MTKKRPASRGIVNLEALPRGQHAEAVVQRGPRLQQLMLQRSLVMREVAQVVLV